MSKLDISSMKGADLFDALKTGKKITISKELLIPERKPDLWQPDALILIVHKTYCKCCGGTHELPNAHILLRRRHPVDGTHYSSIEGLYDDPVPTLKALPLIREDSITEVRQCQWCWDIEKIITIARKSHEHESISPCPE